MVEVDVKKMHETCMDCENDYLRRNKLIDACKNCVYNALRTKGKKNQMIKRMRINAIRRMN